MGLTRLTREEVADLSLEELVERSDALHQLNVLEARESAAAFVEFAIPHEQGGAVVNGRHHEEWHAMLDANRMCVLFAPVEHAKTQQIAVGRALWVLGRNPNLRIGLISNTSTQAEKILHSIKQHIVSNPRVLEVFPHLKPSERDEDPWTAGAITVERTVIAKDPSIQAFGIGGALVVGSRLDVIIGDDLLDFENTRTADQLKKVLDWWDTTIFTRLVDGGVVWLIGTPWARGDILHVLEERPGYASARYSAVLNPDEPQANWRPLWPEQFSLQRLITIAQNTTPHNFARKYLCRVVDSASARFQQAWLDQCMDLGKGRTLLSRAPVTPGGRPMPCFTGVDLGVGQKEGHDLSVLFTITVDDAGRRIPVDIESGRWSSPEILSRIWRCSQRFGSIMLVENNGAQDFLLQWARQSGIAVREFTTTAHNKFSEAFGIESIAVEMRSGLWLIPSGTTGRDLHPEVRAWCQDMVFYSPNAHTGDRLMASWFAREGARSVGVQMTGQTNTLAR